MTPGSLRLLRVQLPVLGPARLALEWANRRLPVLADVEYNLGRRKVFKEMSGSTECAERPAGEHRAGHGPIARRDAACGGGGGGGGGGDVAADVTAEVGATVFSALFCPRQGQGVGFGPGGGSPPPLPPLPGASPGADLPTPPYPGCGAWAPAWGAPVAPAPGAAAPGAADSEDDSLWAARAGPGPRRGGGAGLPDADASEPGARRALAGVQRARSGRARGAVAGAPRSPTGAPAGEDVASSGSGWAPPGGGRAAAARGADPSADPGAASGLLDFHDGAPVHARLLESSLAGSPAGSPASRRALQPVSARAYACAGCGDPSSSARSPLGRRGAPAAAATAGSGDAPVRRPACWLWGAGFCTYGHSMSPV